jgi:hypothetical protein
LGRFDGILCKIRRVCVLLTIPVEWSHAAWQTAMVDGTIEEMGRRLKHRGSTMQMVKIHIPERSDRAKALDTLTLRGRVICLPDNIFIVPEPALEVLQSLTVSFKELERGGFDYAEKALRDSLAAQV